MSIILSGGQISSSSITPTGQFKKTLCSTYGLISYWDCAVTSSWVNGSSTLYDLTATGNNLTANGSITTSTFGSTLGWNFDADGKYFSSTSAGGGPTKNTTIEAWIYPAASEVTSGDRGTIILWSGGSALYHSWNKGNNQLSSYWYSHPPEGYHESTPAMTRGNWYYTAGIWDYAQSVQRQFVNLSTGQVTGVQGNAQVGANIYIGREGSSRQFSGGIALVRVWNRALHSNEILNNYLVEKSRFGL